MSNGNQSQMSTRSLHHETKILEALPKNLKGSLPTIEEIGKDFQKQKE